jgi:hypothetical protein
MNKLLNPNGGMPLYGNDLVFMDAAVRDAIAGVLYEFAKPYNGYLILGGCELTASGSTVTMAKGYLMANYEVYAVAAATWNIGSGLDGTFVLRQDIDVAGLRTFANGVSQSPWQIRNAVFVPGPLAGGSLDMNEMVRLSNAIYQAMKGYKAQSTAFSLVLGWSKGVAPNDPILRKHFDTVTLVGDLLVGTLTQTTWTKISILPSGFRPAKRVKCVCMAYNSASQNGNVYLDIFPNGEVYAQNGSALAWDLVSMNVSWVV